MNDDPTPAATASGSARQGDAEVDNENPPDATGGEPRGHGSLAAEPLASLRRANWLGPALQKKIYFITHLLTCLDTLVFAELAALYYMECSFLRLALRAAAQYVFLTPKPDAFPLKSGVPSLAVAIIGPNLFCILWHLFTVPPVASEASRGHLNGGIILDFIGQKPPSSRIVFLLLDLAIFAMQSLMFAVHSERETVRQVVRYARRHTPAVARGPVPPRTQDLDAEERGVVRETSDLTRNDTNDIELQPLQGVDKFEERVDQIDIGLQAGAGGSQEAAVNLLEPMDVLNSGFAIIGEYHIIDTMRTATSDYEWAAAQSFQTLGYTATLAAHAARAPGQRFSRRRQR